VIHEDRCELIHQNGHPFNSSIFFAKILLCRPHGRNVLDGEIAFVSIGAADWISKEGLLASEDFKLPSLTQ
jgi:hypothetical protein